MQCGVCVMCVSLFGVGVCNLCVFNVCVSMCGLVCVCNIRVTVRRDVYV